MPWEELEYYATGKARWYPYTCPHCSKDVSGGVVAATARGPTYPLTLWLDCPNCRVGSVCVNDTLYPPSPFGPEVDGLPADVADAYQEARNCMGVGAFTAAELICRKLLMHVAADKGAKAGEAFITYLDFLGEGRICHASHEGLGRSH
jgi:hypothetical protein